MPPSQRSAPGRQESRASELTPFEEALRQIQEALAEGRTAEREPEPEPVPKPVQRTLSPSRLDKPTPNLQAPEPAAKLRFFDDKLDATAVYTEPGADEHYHEPLGKEIAAVATRPRKRKKLSKWQKAIVNVVVLNAPRSRRPWSPPDLR